LLDGLDAEERKEGFEVKPKQNVQLFPTYEKRDYDSPGSSIDYRFRFSPNYFDLYVTLNLSHTESYVYFCSRNNSKPVPPYSYHFLLSVPSTQYIHSVGAQSKATVGVLFHFPVRIYG